MNTELLMKLLNNGNGLGELANIQQTTNQIICDEKCRKDKKGLDLYNEFLKAKKDSTENPEKLKKAERDYLIFEKGGNYYRNFLEKNANKEIEKYAKDLEKDFQDEFRNLKILLNKYNSQKTYEKNIDDLVSTYDDKVSKLKTKYSDLENKNNINHRLKIYEDNETNYYNTIIYYMKLIYYVFFTIFVAYKVIYKGNIRNTKNLISIFLLLILPLFV